MPDIDLTTATARVFWSHDDGEYVATVEEHPGVSGLGATPLAALAQLLVVLDAARGEPPGGTWDDAEPAEDTEDHTRHRAPITRTSVPRLLAEATAGPWVPDDPSWMELNDISVWAPSSGDPQRVNSDGDILLCNLGGPVAYVNAPEEARQSMADARLMAAAPDLGWALIAAWGAADRMANALRKVCQACIDAGAADGDNMADFVRGLGSAVREGAEE